MKKAKGRADRPGTQMEWDAHDAVASENFDQITRLAAFCFDVPVVMLAMTEGGRMVSVSTQGLDATLRDPVQILCERTMLPLGGSNAGQAGTVAAADGSLEPLRADGAGVLEIDDVAAALRTAASPSAIAPPLLFFAGTAITDENGQAVGVLAIADRQRRQLKPAEREQLQALGRLAMSEIALRQSVGRRHALSGLPNEHQLLADLNTLSVTAANEYRVLALVETLDAASAHAVSQALGPEPVEALIVQLGERLHDHLREVNAANMATGSTPGSATGSTTRSGSPTAAVAYHVADTRFAFLRDDMAGADLDGFMEALFRAFGRTVVAEGVPIRPSLRAGLVRVRLGDGMADALRKAVAAVDVSVATNRAWTMYDAQKDAHSQRSHDLATGLQRALANDEFYLVYQPRMESASGRIVCVEALVRWRHTVLGTLFPGEFIPIAERTAVMQGLTSWVADNALAQLKSWREKFPDLRLSINLSPVDFHHEELQPILRTMCERHGIAPGVLEVEIKEGEWIRKRNVLSQLKALRDAGIRVAIDDFGAGYSNSAYLRDIPADVIKMDASLIQDLGENERHQHIVRSMLDLARELGYRTVAEGVESQATLDLLHQWRCDEVQGYLIARPQGVDGTVGVIASRAGL